MKLNLEPNTFLNGYINITSTVIDTTKIHEGLKVIMGDFRNLSPVIDDNSAEEIIFGPYLNRVGPEEMVKILDHWGHKLINGGKLNLTFINIRKVSRDIYSGDLTLAQAHYFIYGEKGEMRTILDLPMVQEAAKSVGLTTDQISLSQHTVSISLIKTPK